MNRIKGTALLVFILSLAVHCQTTFIKTLSFPENHDGYAVRPAFDGGYIMVPKGPPALLIKTDTKGDTLWTRKLPMFLPYSENALLQTTDSGIIICGGNSNMMLMKTGKNGDSALVRLLPGGNGLCGGTDQRRGLYPGRRGRTSLYQDRNRQNRSGRDHRME